MYPWFKLAPPRGINDPDICNVKSSPEWRAEMPNRKSMREKRQTMFGKSWAARLKYTRNRVKGNKPIVNWLTKIAFSRFPKSLAVLFFQWCLYGTGKGKRSKKTLKRGFQKKRKEGGGGGGIYPLLHIPLSHSRHAKKGIYPLLLRRKYTSQYPKKLRKRESSRKTSERKIKKKNSIGAKLPSLLTKND